MKIFFILSSILTVINGIDGLIQGTPIAQSSGQFVASVRSRALDNQGFGRGYLCTATIINNRNVLTAASCVFGLQPSSLTVAMGNPDLTWRNFVTNVEFITIHENYTEGDLLNNNIAVLRLSRSIRQRSSRRNNNQNSHIQPVRLGDSPPQNPPTQCPVFAWGQGNLLLRASLPIWDTNVCGNSSTGVFCAGNINSGPAVCTRNRGGPMICNSRMVGFIIDDSGCSQAGRSGLFHSISHHREWIRRASDADWNKKVSLFLLVVALSAMKFLH